MLRRHFIFIPTCPFPWLLPSAQSLHLAVIVVHWRVAVLCVAVLGYLLPAVLCVLVFSLALFVVAPLIRHDML